MDLPKFDRYEATGILGEGAMGTVYLAFDPRLKREVAIKTVKPEILRQDPGLKARFEREAKIVAAHSRGDKVFVMYGDCGTGGLLDRVLEEEGVERIPGAHCYEFFAGSAAFAALADAEPGTFYLTDFLVTHFERLVIHGLGIDKHPELMPMYFGNYRRLVYLAQVESPDKVAAGQRAADRLGLAYEYRVTGYGELEHSLRRANEGVVFWQN